MKPRVHKEEFKFGESVVTISTDTAFTNPKDMISIQSTGPLNLDSFQADRLMGAILRAVYFSLLGRGINLDQISRLNPMLAADTAQQTTTRVISDIAQECFRRILDDSGSPAAMVAVEYKMAVSAKPKVIIPGKDHQPSIEGVHPEFVMFELRPMPAVS